MDRLKQKQGAYWGYFGADLHSSMDRLKRTAIHHPLSNL